MNLSSSKLKLTLASWNTQSLNLHKKSLNSSFNSEKFLTLKKYHVSKCNIIALQELQTKKNIFKKFATYSLPNKNVIFSSSDNPYESLALYYDSNIKLIEYEEILPGRLLKALFSFEDQFFYVYNVYNFTVSNVNESIALLSILQDDIDFIQPFPTFILGDFNIDLDKISRSSKSFHDLIRHHDLIDLASQFNQLSPTWRGDGKRAISSSRIDYIFIKNYFPQNQCFNILPVPTSDHSILAMEEDIHCKLNSHPFAHIKEHILSDSKFKETFLSKLILILKSKFDFLNLPTPSSKEFFLNIDGKHIDSHVLRFLDDPDYYGQKVVIQLFHEIFLLIADETNLQYKRIKSSKNKKFRKFRNICITLQKNPTEKNMDNFIDAKIELKNQISMSHKIHSEHKRLKKLKSSSHQANDIYYIMGKNGGRNITRIRDPSTGQVTMDPERIVTIFSENYKMKTTDPDNQQNDPPTTFPSVIDDLMKEFNVSIDDIFPNVTEISDETFSFTEIYSVLKNMKNKVSCGPSHISKHTLLFISKYIPNLLTSYVNLLIKKDDISDNEHTSWILAREVIFIRKKSNDFLDVNNFRPISLLESLYKLMSKLTISRFESKIFDCLSHSQFGFVRQRQMSLATHTIVQLIEAIKKKGLNAALISIDIKAAFDSAKHSTLNAALLHLFPNNSLIKCIAKFSHNPVARINIRGVLGEEIKLSKGVGQGDPASSTKYLVLHHVFNFFLERFLEQENLTFSKQDIHESLPNIPQENLSFADDTAMLINHNLNLRKAQRLTVLYSKLKLLTGLEVNPKKSQYFLIGEQFSNDFKSALSILATFKNSIEHLGVILSPNIQEAKNETFLKIAQSMKKKSKILTAGMGSVDTFTKISVVRTIILSKPLHCFRVFSPDIENLDKIWTIFKISLWSKSYQDKVITRTKVASSRLSLPIQDGGLGILHIKTTAALSMLSSFISLLSHAIKDKSSIIAAILHSKPLDHDTAIKFLNTHYFKKFWVKKINRFFPGSSHLTEHLQELFHVLELDELYGLFMPILNHKLLDPKIKFLAVFKPSDFDVDAELSQFPNIISLMEVSKSRHGIYINPLNYNPKIDNLQNKTHQKYLKLLLNAVNDSVSFNVNNFAIKNRHLTFFELVAKYSPKLMLKALKKSAHKILNKNNPPPPSWTSRKKDGCITPPHLSQFQDSFHLTTHPKLPPSLKSFHYDYLSRVTPSLSKLIQFKNNDISSSKCPRPECIRNNLEATSEHIVYDCVFVSSILYVIRQARIKHNINIHMEDMFYLFPFNDQNKNNNFLETFILATQIKITAFKVVIDEKFHAWTFQHFYVKLLNILKSSIQICELYNIPINFLHTLLEYADFAACGLLHSYMYDF